jgi:hypothetical protein
MMGPALRPLRIAAAAAVLLSWSPVARAQESGAADLAGSAWQSISSVAHDLIATVVGLFVDPDPFDYLPEQLSERGRMFLALMEAAGYRLAEIDAGEGLLGDVTYRFKLQRAPSAGDLERVRRGLAEHESRFSGATARAERRALRGLLAVADAPGFQVSAVRMDLLPWPEVRFHLTARPAKAQ